MFFALAATKSSLFSVIFPNKHISTFEFFGMTAGSLRVKTAKTVSGYYPGVVDKKKRFGSLNHSFIA